MGKYSTPDRDDLIGMLVAFEKKAEDSGALAEPEENCTDMQLNPCDTMTTNDSTMVSAHPAYRRHKRSALRWRRSRSTTPFRKRHPPRDDGTTAMRPPLHHQIHDDIHKRDHRIHDIGNHVEIIIGSDKGKTGHVILAASEVVEVQMDDKKERKYFSSNSVRSFSCSEDQSHDDLFLPVKESRDEKDLSRSGSESVTVLEIPANWDTDDLAQKSSLVIITRSESSAFEPVDPPGDKADSVREMTGDGSQSKSDIDEYVAENGGFTIAENRHIAKTHDSSGMAKMAMSKSKSNMDGRVAETWSSYRTNTSDRPPLPKNTRAVRGFSTLKSRIPEHARQRAAVPRTPKISAEHQLLSEIPDCAWLMTKPQSEPFPFPEPHNAEIIWTRNCFKPGNIVHIFGGMYKNRTGRVMKVNDKLVQVEIGGFVQPFYLSSQMLRSCKDSSSALPCFFGSIERASDSGR
jgi:ribosomal protein L24